MNFLSYIYTNTFIIRQARWYVIYHFLLNFRLFFKKISFKFKEKKVVFERSSDAKEERALHGTSRAVVANMIRGVSEGFTKQLEIVGIGYRGAQKGKGIKLQLGYSHPVEYEPPEGITLKMEGNNKISVSGADKQKVGQVAAEIRSFKKPEPYKGKGIRYIGEQVRRKAGKAKG